MAVAEWFRLGGAILVLCSDANADSSFTRVFDRNGLCGSGTEDGGLMAGDGAGGKRGSWRRTRHDEADGQSRWWQARHPARECFETDDERRPAFEGEKHG